MHHREFKALQFCNALFSIITVFLTTFLHWIDIVGNSSSFWSW